MGLAAFRRMRQIQAQKKAEESKQPQEVEVKKETPKKPRATKPKEGEADASTNE